MYPVNMDVISWLGAYHVKNEVYEKVCRYKANLPCFVGLCAWVLGPRECQGCAVMRTMGVEFKPKRRVKG